MKLITVLFFCVAATSALAQQSAPAKTETPKITGACEANTSIQPSLLMGICETIGKPDEVAKLARQLGIEASVSKNKDGRVVSYSVANPTTGKSLVVRKRLIVTN